MQNIKLILVASSIAALTACGGGGGGSSSASNSIQYTGNESQIALDSTNAKQVVSTTMNFGFSGNPSAGSVVGVEISTNNSRPITTLISSVQESIDSSTAGTLVTGVNFQETQACESGDIASDFDVDQNNGIFSGTVSFNNCREHDITTNGKVDVSGQYQLSNGGIDMEMSFPSLSITEIGQGSMTLAGTVDCEEESNDVLTCNQNILMRDDTTGDVYKLRDLIMRMGDEAIALDGFFYDPAKGYIELESDLSRSLQFIDGEDYPYYGTLIILGANNSRVTISVLDSESYELSIDANGDGIVDTVRTESW